MSMVDYRLATADDAAAIGALHSGRVPYVINDR
jgi:hypothetical protein